MLVPSSNETLHAEVARVKCARCNYFRRARDAPDVIRRARNAPDVINYIGRIARDYSPALYFTNVYSRSVFFFEI